MDIYCSNCGAKNNSMSQFCENCGFRLEMVRAPQFSSVRTGRTWNSKIASIGATVVLVCFFLPWVSVSCTALRTTAISVSGYQIATGNISAIKNLNNLGGLFGGIGGLDMSGTSDSTMGALQNQTSSPAVWLIFVIGFLCLLTLLGGKRGGQIAIGVGILGLIALIVFGIKLGNINSQISTFGFRIKTEFGLIFEWLGFLFVTGIGILSLLYPSDHQ